MAGGLRSVYGESSQLSRVQRYIANQMEHHRKKTFEEEYLDLLRLSGVEYDERYLWGGASHPSGAMAFALIREQTFLLIATA